MIFLVAKPIDARQEHNLERLQIDGLTCVWAFDMSSELYKLKNMFGLRRYKLIRRILTLGHIQKALAGKLDVLTGQYVAPDYAGSVLKRRLKQWRIAHRRCSALLSVSDDHGPLGPIRQES